MLIGAATLLALSVIVYVLGCLLPTGFTPWGIHLRFVMVMTTVLLDLCALWAFGLVIRSQGSVAS